MKVADQDDIGIVGMYRNRVDVGSTEVIVVIDTAPTVTTVIAAPHPHGIHVGCKVHDVGVARRERYVADVAAWWIRYLGQFG